MGCLTVSYLGLDSDSNAYSLCNNEQVTGSLKILFLLFGLHGGILVDIDWDKECYKVARRISTIVVWLQREELEALPL